MEENRPITLKLVDFNDLERNNLRVILTLASRALKRKWHIVETDTADFFLLSVAATANLSSDDRLKNLPIDCCMFCSTAKGTQTKHTLLVDEKRLPSLSALVTLFNRIAAGFNATAEINLDIVNPVPDKANNSQQPDEEGFFDPQQGLLGYLSAVEQAQLVISLSNHPDYAPLYIDVEKNAYYSENSLEQLDSYLFNPEALNSQVITKTEMEDCIKHKSLKLCPLKELIWYIAIKTSLGKVIKGYVKTDNVTLRGWPDLRLFKCMDYAKVATFMKNNAASLDAIAEQTKLPLAEIHNFYNACYLMGLIEHKHQPYLHKKTISPERLELLTKIDARLK